MTLFDGVLDVPVLLDVSKLSDYLLLIQNLYGAAQWSYQEPTGSNAGAQNSALALGRDIALNTYADYTAGANWSNPSGQIARHAAGATATLQQDGILAAGRTYQVTITVANRTVGSITITDDGAAISANGETTRTITSTGTDFIITPTSDFDGDIDVSLLLVQQTNIPANDSNLDGTHTGVAVGQSVFGAAGPRAVLYDGVNDLTNIYSHELNSYFNPDLFTVNVFAQVSGAGVWTDSTYRWLFRIAADNDNYIHAVKSITNNQLIMRRKAAASTEDYTLTISTTDVFMITMVATVSGDSQKYYLNGTEIPLSEDTGLLAWVGNLSSSETVIGAASTVPASVWDGWISRPMLVRAELSAAEILKIAQLGGCA